NGRFLEAFLRVNSRARVTVLDVSSRMLTAAQHRLTERAMNLDRVEFIQKDILEWPGTLNPYDLVVSHFFLDCFRPEQLETIIARVSRLTSPEAIWLLADFHACAPGLAGLRARLLLKIMYVFFRRVTALPAKRLTSPDPFLQDHGFVLIRRHFSEWNLLHSDLWRKDDIRRQD
ncbi:MAG: class I SAM-dependent methyltransferase, partial [Opitutales bacterium]